MPPPSAEELYRGRDAMGMSGWIQRAKADRLSVEEASRLLIAEKQPQVQFTTAEQIAGLAVFLASDTASNMQGTALVSDGGWTAQ